MDFNSEVYKGFVEKISSRKDNFSQINESEQDILGSYNDSPDETSKTIIDEYIEPKLKIINVIDYDDRKNLKISFTDEGNIIVENPGDKGSAIVKVGNVSSKFKVFLENLVSKIGEEGIGSFHMDEVEYDDEELNSVINKNITISTSNNLYEANIQGDTLNWVKIKKQSGQKRSYTIDMGCIKE